MFKTASALTAAALLLGAAGHVCAAEVTPARGSNLTSQPTASSPWSLTGPRKSLQWDSKGKWGLRLDMNQSSVREPDWRDVAAGAFFRITPSLRVGGSVQLGDRFAERKQMTPSDTAPRVHLETAFRF